LKADNRADDRIEDGYRQSELRSVVAEESAHLNSLPPVAGGSPALHPQTIAR
jgi:hypothetical protein